MPRTRVNTVLKQALSELGWSPRDLSRHLNKAIGECMVSATAPYHWRDNGRVPRAPLPPLVAGLLSQQLGRPITVMELWGTTCEETSAVMSADRGFQTAPTQAGMMKIVDDWVASGLTDRQLCLAISGHTLVDLAATGSGASPSIRRRPEVSGPLLEQIEATVPLLQQLDDTTGGGRYLPYVGTHFRAIAILIRDGRHSTTVGQGLLTALADVGQLAGWMAFDSGQHGLAQRYYLTALNATQHTGYRPMAAHILADLAFQAATREYPSDAITLGERAVRAAAHSPASVRASIHSRLAYGYALAGRLEDFDRAYRAGLDTLESRGGDPDPAWMYFLTPGHLDAQAGYALTHATIALRAGSPPATALLRRGQRLLDGGAHTYPLGSPSERRALFEGAWLAVATAQLGDLERACHHGRRALRRLPHVQSQRSDDVLRLLARRLRRATRNPYVADFLPELEHALNTRGAV